jgi:hypothetical protein
MEIYKGNQFQRGYGHRGAGLGGLLNKFMKFAVPHVEAHLPKLIESTSKSLESNLPKLVDSGITALADKISKKNINQLNILKEKEIQTITPDKQQEAKDIYFSRGKGLKKSIKRKKLDKNYIILKKAKKSRVKDIFDLNNAF